MEAREEIIKSLKEYDATFDEVTFNRAFDLAKKAHSHQFRASGEPYFSHPLAVAKILLDLRLDTRSIITALLHDVLEDTPVTLSEINTLFGPEIAQLVAGVTKLSNLEQFGSKEFHQAENFRKLLLAISSDIRVLLIKLADRLHNMRTLHFVPDEDKRRRIAIETMAIYAQLAERMGMQNIKDELEDLSFTILHPEVRSSIMTRLCYLYHTTSNKVAETIAEIKHHMEKAGITAQITGREKTPYSIWRKMQRKNVAFEQLSDIMAFRVIVTTVANCYNALGIMYERYAIVPGHFKDYITTPKPNRYQSIHSTWVIPQNNHHIEVQIRTQEMHEIAELGVAAHWQYKQEVILDSKQYAWLRGLLEILEQSSTPEEFLANTKLEMFRDQVFCFTPKGELIALPKGATSIDFAYAVHSQIGNCAIGVKINGKQMPLRTILHNGDQLEIITSHNQTPSPSWERFVVTNKARTGIRKFARSISRTKDAALGRSLVLRAFNREGLHLDEKVLATAASNYFQGISLEELYIKVGSGTLDLRKMMSTVYPPQDRPPLDIGVNGLLAGASASFAECCHPIPGDQITGIINLNNQIMIHTLYCKRMIDFTVPERLLCLSWDDKVWGNHVGRLRVKAANSPDSFAVIATTVSQTNSEIVNLKINNCGISQSFDCLIDIEVRDSNHLVYVMAALQATPIVTYVERM